MHIQSASAGATLCSSNSSTKFTLLIAEVLIGNIVKGSSGLTREKTSAFDTTTDNIENPTVFVKYNSQEYYPLYIVEIQFCIYKYGFITFFRK
ncbi:hypothetical protein Avbf_00638 [Armadillidium vulgare]|nr:hypothetical protein Avbf_00638 [Armadillidium vulgare]